MDCISSFNQLRNIHIYKYQIELQWLCVRECKSCICTIFNLFFLVLFVWLLSWYHVYLQIQRNIHSILFNLISKENVITLLIFLSVFIFMSKLWYKDSDCWVFSSKFTRAIYHDTDARANQRHLKCLFQQHKIDGQKI